MPDPGAFEAANTPEALGDRGRVTPAIRGTEDDVTRLAEAPKAMAWGRRHPPGRDASSAGRGCARGLAARRERRPHRAPRTFRSASARHGRRGRHGTVAAPQPCRQGRRLCSPHHAGSERSTPMPQHPLRPYTRRRFLGTTGGAALTAASGLAMPSIVRAQSRPTFTHGVQSGDVDTSSGMAWVRADRPARIDFEWATTESFADPTRLHALDATPNRDLAVKRLLTGLPSDQRHLLARHGHRPHRRERRLRAHRRALPHRARLAPLGALRLVGRHRRAGLGHRRLARRHADLRHHGAPRARLLHPLGRHDLRRRSHGGDGGARGRRDVAQPRDARRRPRSPRRWTSSAASGSTTSSTRTSSPSTPPSRPSSSGTTTRSSTTGPRARI